MQSISLAEHVAAALEILSHGVMQVDQDWLVLYLNSSAERLLDVNRADVRGQTFWNAVKGLPADFVSETLCAHGRKATCVCQLGNSAEWREISIEGDGQGGRVIQIQDVTSLKRAEMALEAQSEFLQAVLDNVQAGIVACDETGTLKLFNNATRAFHGLDQKPLPPDQWPSYYDLYHADGVTPLRKEEVPLYRAFSGEVVRNAEIVIAPRNGPRRTVLASGRALVAGDGRKLGAVVAMNEITHRKVSSQRVRNALRQYRTLFNDAPIAYHEIDCFGIVRRVNRAECRLLERSREELLGQPIWDLVAEHEREQTKHAVLESIASPHSPPSVTRQYLTKSGKTLLLELYENAIVDPAGRVVGIRTAMLDVTDREKRHQQAQELVRETAAREQAEAASAELKNILERIGDAYIAFDPEWRYTYVNRKAADLARKPADELIGRSVWDQFPEAVHTRFFSELQRCLREQVPVEFVNYYAPLGKWFENAVYPSASGVGVFYRDITERVRAQKALEKQAAELALKNAELETFAYVASHDLQEPLRMVAGYAALLSKRYSGAIDSRADDFLRYITQGVDRMQRLIRDLLALCRLGNEPVEALEEVSVGRVVDYVCANLDISIEESGAVIQRSELPVIRFNETRLMQVIQNLIANAIKYRRKAPPLIVITAVRQDEGWLISVEDNGAGFDMRDALRVFEPFRRLHRNDDGGTGIGLAICKKIVEHRGGRIWVDSVPGKGSTFQFTIPDDIPTNAT